MQFNIVDDDVVAPIYTCGKRGESIDVQVHGVNYTTWKVLDNFEKHIGKRPKISCKVCHGEQDAFEKLLQAIGVLGESARTTTTNILEMAKHINLNGGNK